MFAKIQMLTQLNKPRKGFEGSQSSGVNSETWFLHLTEELILLGFLSVPFQKDFIHQGDMDHPRERCSFLLARVQKLCSFLVSTLSQQGAILSIFATSHMDLEVLTIFEGQHSAHLLSSAECHFQFGRIFSFMWSSLLSASCLLRDHLPGPNSLPQ